MKHTINKFNEQFAHIETVGNVRGSDIHAVISGNIANNETTEVTEVFGEGYTADFEVKTAPISITIKADAVRITKDSIDIVEFKTGTFDESAAKRQVSAYAFGINRVSPRDTFNVTIISIDSEQVIKYTMTHSDMVSAYEAAHSKRIANDKANNPSTISVSGRVIGEVIGVATSSVTYFIRETNSRDHKAVFSKTEVPGKVGSKTNSTYAFTRDIIFDVIMYYGIHRDVTNPIARASANEVAKVGIDTFIERHFK